ncbi:MAG: galactose-1-phosphate uridylyltransferase [Candidatus Lokiarchaeota archaeon]|nr:galactose-1-phosphate uridylyltransferase [Candidatus Lokiarchaeota archaeon]
MTELRWNPILQEWTIMAGHRAKRPQVHKKSKREEDREAKCPFCPGSKDVKGDWEVLSLLNKYPSLQFDPPTPDVKGTNLMPVRPAKGICEVIIYTKDHNKTLDKLSLDHIVKLVELWKDRYEAIGNKKDIKYVFIFENTGAEIGVSLDHPHGQLYSFTFIPPRIERELKSSKMHYEKNEECLFCGLIDFEMDEKKRIVYENDNFICFVPFFTQYSYGTHIYPKRHLQSLLDFNEDEIEDFARILKEILGKYHKKFPDQLDYIMIFHQKPTTEEKYGYFHFYVEFVIIQRGYGKKKYLGGVERGTGTIINASIPEEKAEELRKI